MAVKLRPLTPERVADLPDACACCAFWESDDSLSTTCGSVCDADRFVAWVQEVTSEWGDCGRVAYVDGKGTGFVKYAPARFLPQVRHMAAGAPSEDAVVLACLHVASGARHAGLGKMMLHATMRDLVSRGERALEAYGAASPSDRLTTPMMTVEFLIRQGFTVIRPHPRYPLMRLEMKSLAAWTENIEAMLESLQLPLHGRERVPAPTARAAPGIF